MSPTCSRLVETSRSSVTRSAGLAAELGAHQADEVGLQLLLGGVHRLLEGADLLDAGVVAGFEDRDGPAQHGLDGVGDARAARAWPR
jgi:hypothetical protein